MRVPHQPRVDNLDKNDHRETRFVIKKQVLLQGLNKVIWSK